MELKLRNKLGYGLGTLAKDLISPIWGSLTWSQSRSLNTYILLFSYTVSNIYPCLQNAEDLMTSKKSTASSDGFCEYRRP